MEIIQQMIEQIFEEMSNEIKTSQSEINKQQQKQKTKIPYLWNKIKAALKKNFIATKYNHLGHIHFRAIVNKATMNVVE